MRGMSTPTGWRMSVFIWVDASTPVPVQWSTRLHPRKGVPIWVETSSAMVRPILRAENSAISFSSSRGSEALFIT